MSDSEEPEIVVTGARVVQKQTVNQDSGGGGGWCLGWGSSGAYGEFCATSFDAFVGIGIGRPGPNIDYEGEADLSGLDISPTTATYRFPVTPIATAAYGGGGVAVAAPANAIDAFADAFVDRYYPQGIDGFTP